MNAQKKRLHTRIISAIVMAIAIALVMIPSVEDEGVVYGYGGGGGGGGAPSNPNWTVCAEGNCDTGDVNFWGTALDNFWAVSDDISIHIPEYTDMKGPEGKRLPEFRANQIDVPPSAPEGYKVLAAFEFNPSGATFDPGITINIRFDPGEVAAGETVAIAYYNEATGAWEFLEGTITADGQAVFTMEHCSIYGLLASVAPVIQPTPTAAPAETPSEGGLGTGALVGILIAALVVLAVILYFVLAKKRRAGKAA